MNLVGLGFNLAIPSCTEHAIFFQSGL